jgi:hypothetical protein
MMIPRGLRELGHCLAVVALVGVGAGAVATSLHVDRLTEHYLVDGASAGLGAAFLTAAWLLVRRARRAGE